MKSKLIALDIDGTILDKSAGVSVPHSVRMAVRDAREAGAHVCLCSSRPCFFMDDASADLDEVDSLVGCSGATIEMLNASGVKNGEKIYKDQMPSELIIAAYEIAKKHKLYASFCTEEKVLVRKRGPLKPPTAVVSVFHVMSDAGLLKELNARAIFCAYIFLEPGMEDKILTDVPLLKNATMYHSGHNCLTVTNGGTDKGSGVLRLAKHLGINREEILAIGNDENDIPMLKAAGIGVAVANASPGVLAVADWIAPDVREGGAAEAIRRFAL